MSAAELRSIPVAALYESPNNPRASFDIEALAELVASIKEKGVITPLLVRPNGKPDKFEILAGHRRFRAAKQAGIGELPAIVRELDDRAALEVMILDNLQREDVHPLEEAAGFKKLIAMGPGKTTAAAIGAKIGKSQEYVYARLKLLELIPECQKAFREGKMQAGHAILLARLDADEQEEVFEDEFWTDDDGSMNAPSVRDVEREIQWRRQEKEAAAARQAEGKARELVAPARAQAKLRELQGQLDRKAWAASINAVLEKFRGKELPRAAWLIIAEELEAGRYIFERIGLKPRKLKDLKTGDIPLELLAYRLASPWEMSHLAKALKSLGVEPIKPEKAKLDDETPAAKPAKAKGKKRPRSKAKK